jgi:hypothetical protein
VYNPPSSLSRMSPGSVRESRGRCGTPGSRDMRGSERIKTEAIVRCNSPLQASRLHVQTRSAALNGARTGNNETTTDTTNVTPARQAATPRKCHTTNHICTMQHPALTVTQPVITNSCTLRRRGRQRRRDDSGGCCGQQWTRPTTSHRNIVASLQPLLLARLIRLLP